MSRAPQNQPDKRWTLWWWPNHLNDPGTRDVPVPYSHENDDLDNIKAAAQTLADSGSCTWVKVFKTNDETDERFRWPSPRHGNTT